MHRLLLPLLLAAAAACDSDPAGPRGLRANAIVNAAAPADAPNVTLQVRNRGSRSVYLPRCGDFVVVYVERREEARWTDYPIQICPLVLRPPLELAPGEVVETKHRVDEPGRYRARFQAQSSTSPESSLAEVATEFVIE
jgi:hypothetical protein